MILWVINQKKKSCIHFLITAFGYTYPVGDESRCSVWNKGKKLRIPYFIEKYVY